MVMPTPPPQLIIPQLPQEGPLVSLLLRFSEIGMLQVEFLSTKLRCTRKHLALFLTQFLCQSFISAGGRE